MNTSLGKCFRGSSSLHTSKIFTSDNKTRMPPTTPVNHYPWHANPQSGPRVPSFQRQFNTSARLLHSQHIHNTPTHTTHTTHNTEHTQSDRHGQTDRHRHRHKHAQTDRQTDRQTDSQRNKETRTHINTSTQQHNTTQDNTRQDKTRQNKTRQEKTGQDETRRDETGQVHIQSERTFTDISA